MPIFLFIRHGETDYNKKMYLPGRLPDVHLNKKGHQQAQAVAERLASVPIKGIYASPLDRTMETAKLLADILKLEITPMAGLLETDSGEWQGQSIKKLRRQKIWQSVQRHPSLFTFPRGESIGECQHRIVQAVESLRMIHAPEDLVACFSHADPIKLAIAYYLGLSLDNFQRLAIDPGSVSVLHITDNGSRLIMLNHNPSFAWDVFQPPKSGKKIPSTQA
jgi:probable phosphomutase (TIGR03848 family)